MVKEDDNRGGGRSGRTRVQGKNKASKDFDGLDVEWERMDDHKC